MAWQDASAGCYGEGLEGGEVGYFVGLDGAACAAAARRAAQARAERRRWRSVGRIRITIPAAGVGPARVAGA